MVDGFSTWKNATGAFKKRKKSELHAIAIKHIIKQDNKSVLDHLSEAKQKDMLQSTVALKTIFTSVIFLAKQGLAIRGHTDDHSNLLQILNLRAKDVSELES